MELNRGRLVFSPSKDFPSPDPIGPSPPGRANSPDLMGNARTYLKSMEEELHEASPETWAQQKDKVGEAWMRAQEAYGKVKSSTTS